MKKILLSFAFICALGLVAACSNSKEPPKSPCVGAANSPCDWRKPNKNA